MCDVENEWADTVVTGLALLMRGHEAVAPEEVPFYLRTDETEREVRRKIPGNVGGRCGTFPPAASDGNAIGRNAEDKTSRKQGQSTRAL